MADHKGEVTQIGPQIVSHSPSYLGMPAAADRQDLSPAAAKAFKPYFQLRAAERKRPHGTPVPWAESARTPGVVAAIAAGYQRKRGLVPPLITLELEPGEAIQAMVHSKHPLGRKPKLDQSLKEAMPLMALSASALTEQREGWIDKIDQWAEALREESLIEIFACEPMIRNLFLKNVDKPRQQYKLGEFVHLALYRHLHKVFKCADTEWLDHFKNGHPIIGEVARSGRWPKLKAPLPPELTEDELLAKAWETQQRVAKKAATCQNRADATALWKAAIVDRDAGHSLGPFYTNAKLAEAVGTKDFLPMPRNAVTQKGSVRGVDDASRTGSGVNLATSSVDKLVLPTLDKNLGVIQRLAAAAPLAALFGWVLDEKSAYRQIPVLPSHRRYAVVALYDPKRRCAAYFVMIGHAFGFVSAVYNFNRRAAIIDEFLHNMGLLSFQYYDDKFGFTTQAVAELELQLVAKLHTCLGVDFSVKKLQCASLVNILGIEYNFDKMLLGLLDQRRKDLLEEIDHCIDTGRLEPGQAGKLKGKLQFVASHYRGRYGRSFLRALSERQYSRCVYMTPVLSRVLKFWRHLLGLKGCPRSMQSRDEEDCHGVLFTDGWSPDPQLPEQAGKPDCIGWVFFDTRKGDVVYSSYTIPAALRALWMPRQTQIAVVEAAAPAIAVAILGGRLSLLPSNGRQRVGRGMPREGLLRKGGPLRACRRVLGH